MTENAGYLVRPDPFRPEGMQFERTEWIQRCITEMWHYLQEWTVPERRRGWGYPSSYGRRRDPDSLAHRAYWQS